MIAKNRRLLACEVAATIHHAYPNDPVWQERIADLMEEAVAAHMETERADPETAHAFCWAIYENCVNRLSDYSRELHLRTLERMGTFPVGAGA